MDEQRAKRNTKTRGKIKAALTELMVEKGFDAITVSDITRRAGINRGTFYLHFVDKYDALDQLEDEVIGELEEILLRPAHEDDEQTRHVDLFPYPVILEAVRYVTGDFAFVSAISGKGGDQDFSRKLKRIIFDLLDQGLERAGATLDVPESFDADYVREICVSHVIAIIDLWLARGGVEPAEQVARMVCDAKDIAPQSLVRL